MDYDYIIAKLHALHASGFYGEKLESLKKLNSVERIRDELFPDEEAAFSGETGISEIERMLRQKIFGQINFIAKYFLFSDRLVNCMILRYETDNLKSVLSAHYENRRLTSGLFEVDLKGGLDYGRIYSSDITSFDGVKNILENTMFGFVIPMIDEGAALFRIINAVDIFYFRKLVKSAAGHPVHVRDILSCIIREEIDWQNIIWALRLKLHYLRNFNESRQSFIQHGGSVLVESLSNFFRFSLVPSEAESILKGLPQRYAELLRSFFADEGFDLDGLESAVFLRMHHVYSKYFYFENSNILPVISFIQLKKYEYAALIGILESARYGTALL